MCWEAGEGRQVSSDKDRGAVRGKKERSGDAGDARRQSFDMCRVE